MSSANECFVLGALIVQPQLFGADENLDAGLFSEGRHRKTFEIISASWEDTAGIPLRLLTDGLGGDGAIDFIRGLVDGMWDVPPETFRLRVSDLRRDVIKRRLFSKIERESRSAITTGDFSLDEIIPDLDELRRLDEPKADAVISLAEVEEKPIHFFWKGRIPKAMVSLLVGNPGAGKSLLTEFIAAQKSRGRPLPDDGTTEPPCSSLFILGEDPLAQAVKPRALANDADVSKILVLENSGFSIADTRPLFRVAEQHKDLGFVVIDPLSGFLPPRTRYFEDPSIRQALLPLVGFAEKSGVAVLAVAHLRKAEAEDAIYRVAGSIGLAAIARSILSVTPDDEDPGRRLLLPLKANYSKKPSGLAFRIGDDLRVLFEAEPVVTTDAETELSGRDRREEIKEKAFSVSWLREFLEKGPQDSRDVVAAAKQIGVSESSLRRAAHKIGVVGDSRGFGRFKTAEWRLPE
jgi:hypothetical protein